MTDETDVDVEAFHTGESAIVTRTRQVMLSINAKHSWPNPETQAKVTEDLLTLIAAVPYDGDDSAYSVAVWTVACEFMKPFVLICQEFDKFRRMPTEKTIQ
jgi:hypothetical protein